MLLLEPSGSSTCIPQAVSSLSASRSPESIAPATVPKQRVCASPRPQKANVREPAADERRGQSIGGVGGRRGARV